ncbi:hypothetical protein COB21_02355 [Candidatus Aerophobetes bacterium]|uniref:Uncharacterized protein n=1 Tax=Aerophobetes bacterium TaxID=2030807 RepID=A0A2A4X7A1_UNCAE|nr:MAG: hypothetical protein COB21_02355 [Candidatus Aerophobetes bacterium]
MSVVNNQTRGISPAEQKGSVGHDREESKVNTSVSKVGQTAIKQAAAMATRAPVSEFEFEYDAGLVAANTIEYDVNNPGEKFFSKEFTAKLFSPDDAMTQDQEVLKYCHDLKSVILAEATLVEQISGSPGTHYMETRNEKGKRVLSTQGAEYYKAKEDRIIGALAEEAYHYKVDEQNVLGLIPKTGAGAKAAHLLLHRSADGNRIAEVCLTQFKAATPEEKKAKIENFEVGATQFKAEVSRKKQAKTESLVQQGYHYNVGPRGINVYPKEGARAEAARATLERTLTPPDVRNICENLLKS